MKNRKGENNTMYDVQTNDISKLKPCSCGCNPEVKVKPLMYWVECPNCGFSKRYFLNEESAINEWNK